MNSRTLPHGSHKKRTHLRASAMIPSGYYSRASRTTAPRTRRLSLISVRRWSPLSSCCGTSASLNFSRTPDSEARIVSCFASGRLYEAWGTSPTRLFPDQSAACCAIRFDTLVLRQPHSDIRKYPRYHRPIALLPHFRFNGEEGNTKGSRSANATINQLP
jgi:hypothetical protein